MQSNQTEHPARRHPLESPPPPNQKAKSRPAGPRVTLDMQPTRPLVTQFLLVVNIAIFIVGFLSVDVNNQLLDFGWNFPPEVVVNGEYHRLFTSMFLHGDVMHIFFNMYLLYYVGYSIEPILGHTRFALIYVLGGLTGSILSVLLGDFGIPSIGASGAIFAIWISEGVLLYRHREVFGEQMTSRFRSILFFAGLNLLLGFISPRIDNWGHIGGMLGGIILTWFIGVRFSFEERMDAMGNRFLIGRDANPLEKRIPIVIGYIGLLILLLLVTVLVLRP